LAKKSKKKSAKKSKKKSAASSGGSKKATRSKSAPKKKKSVKKTAKKASKPTKKITGKPAKKSTSTKTTKATGTTKSTKKSSTNKSSANSAAKSPRTTPTLRKPAPEAVTEEELVYPAPADADLYPYVLADDLEPKQLKKLKSGLNKKQVAEYFKLLLEKRAEIYGDYSAMEKARSLSAGEISNMPLHMADVGSDNFDQEFTLGLMQSERRNIAEIEEALQRCKDNSYGICFKTGRPIPRARLDAKPWAKYSIEVVRELERLGRSA